MPYASYRFRSFENETKIKIHKLKQKRQFLKILDEIDEVEDVVKPQASILYACCDTKTRFLGRVRPKGQARVFQISNAQLTNDPEYFEQHFPSLRSCSADTLSAPTNFTGDNGVDKIGIASDDEWEMVNDICVAESGTITQGADYRTAVHQGFVTVPPNFECV